MATEQDKESDRLSILAAMQHHRKEISSLQVSIRKANLASKAIIDKNEKEELLGGKSSIVRQRYAKKKHVLLLCKVSTVIFLHYNMLNILQDVKCKLEVIFIALKLLF